MHRAFLVQGLPLHFPDLYSPTDAAPQFCRNLPPLFIYSIVMKQYITSTTQHQKPDEDMTALFISKCVWTKLVTLALSQSGIMLSSTRFLMMRSSYSIKMVVNQDKTTVYRVSFNHQFELFFCDILHSLTVPISVILSWATSPSGGSWPSSMDQTVMHFFIFRQKLCEIEITMPLQRFTPSGSCSGKCGTAKKPLTISKVKRWRFFYHAWKEVIVPI